MYTRILSIDGGGIRGLIPAQILVSLEEKLQQRSDRPQAHISDYFDLIAGTSTGGLITLLLLAPDEDGQSARFHAQDIVDFYLKHGEEIFSNSFWGQIRSLAGLTDERYDASGLERLIDEFVGDLRLSQLIKPCLVTAYDMTNRHAKFFTQHDAVLKEKDKDKDYPVKVVARSTSAAPTYFEAVAADDSPDPYAYVDGGVFANNPAMCAYVEAYKKLEGRPTAPNMVMVSLGTGHIRRAFSHDEIKNWGLVQWIRPLIDVLMGGAAETVDYQMRQLFTAYESPERYLRIQTQINPDDKELMALDNVSSENLHRLVDLGKILANQYDEQLNLIADYLVFGKASTESRL